MAPLIQYIHVSIYLSINLSIYVMNLHTVALCDEPADHLIVRHPQERLERVHRLLDLELERARDGLAHPLQQRGAPKVRSHHRLGRSGRDVGLQASFGSENRFSRLDLPKYRANATRASVGQASVVIIDFPGSFKPAAAAERRSSASRRAAACARRTPRRPRS